jgi:ABC-2 type transport system permease protein
VVYLTVIAKAFRQSSIYRLNVYASVISSLLSLLVKVSLWSVLLAGGKSVQGIGISDMLTYIVVMQLIGALTGGNIGALVSQRVEQGTIAMDLVRPMNLKWAVMAEAFGRNLFELAFTTIPPVAVVAIVFGIHLPSHPVTLILFAASLILGIALSYFVGYLLGLTSFWFKTTFHVDWFNMAFMILFGGSFVPLWFYPRGLERISRFLPFRMIAFDPLNVFLERLTLPETVQVLALQAAWVVLLAGACELVWISARRVVTVHGG